MPEVTRTPVVKVMTMLTGEIAYVVPSGAVTSQPLEVRMTLSTSTDSPLAGVSPR